MNDCPAGSFLFWTLIFLFKGLDTHLQNLHKPCLVTEMIWFCSGIPFSPFSLDWQEQKPVPRNYRSNLKMEEGAGSCKRQAGCNSCFWPKSGETLSFYCTKAAFFEEVQDYGPLPWPLLLGRKVRRTQRKALTWSPRLSSTLERTTRATPGCTEEAV